MNEEEINQNIKTCKDVAKGVSNAILSERVRNSSDQVNYKLISESWDDNKFCAPFKKRKREEIPLSFKEESSDKSADYNFSLVKIIQEDDKYANNNNTLKYIHNDTNNTLEKEIFKEFFLTDNQDYDPYYPNDYEKILEDIKSQRKEKEIEAKIQEKKKKKLTQMDKILSGNEKGSGSIKDITTKISKSQLKVRKMLEKMGWKGQGLGKYEQGIVTPLIMKKTSEKYGIIINSNTKSVDKKIPVNLRNFYNRAPTNILMITNMVSPEEINEVTYNKISGESEKYGNVIDIKFFHFHLDTLPSSEAVRIFIEYDCVDSAIKAFESLYDKLFLERLIRVKFYDDQLYYNNQLDSFNYS